MTLNYKILWFEDEESWYNSILPDFEEFLFEKGYILKPKREDSGKNIDTMNNKKDYDLILIDYGLIDDETGDVIIQKIRECDIFTDIIFYSQRGEDFIRGKMKEKGLDGVFCATRDRDYFIPKIKKVINSTLKKVEDLNNVRGLVMAATSELDVKIEEIIFKFFKTATDQDKMKIEKKIKSEYIEFAKDSIKKAEKSQENYGFSNFLQIINSTHKWRALKRLCKQLNNLKQYESEVNLYEEEILKKRNLLAHVKEVFDNFGNVKLVSSIPGYSSYNFDEDEAIRIRTNLLKYFTLFNKLFEKL